MQKPFLCTNLQLMLALPEVSGDFIVSAIEELVQRVQNNLALTDSTAVGPGKGLDYQWEPGDDMIIVTIPPLTLLNVAALCTRLHAAGFDSTIYAR